MVRELIVPCLTFKIREKLTWRLVLGAYSFPWEYDGETGHFVVGDTVIVAETNKDQVEVHVYSLKNDCADIDEKIIVSFFDLTNSYTEFYEKALKDPLLSEFAKKYYGWRPRRSDLWWATVIGICQQNASFLQGWKMLASIIKLYGRRMLVGNKELLVPPTPNDILKHTELLIQAKTGYRAETIMRVAKLFVEKPSSEIEFYDLVSIRGIGEYTASLAMVLARRDYWRAPIDRWLKRIIAHVYCVNDKDAPKIYQRLWGKYQGLTALATTIALDAVPLRQALKRIDEGKTIPSIMDKPTPANMWMFTGYW